MKRETVEGDKIGKNQVKAFRGLGKEFGFYSDQERCCRSSYLRGVTGSRKEGGVEVCRAEETV